MYFNRDDEDKPIKIDSSSAKIIGALFFIYVYSSIYEFKSFWWDIALVLLVLLGAVLYGIGWFYMEKRYWPGYLDRTTGRRYKCQIRDIFSKRYLHSGRCNVRNVATR